MYICTYTQYTYTHMHIYTYTYFATRLDYREASWNITRKASQMIDKASLAQRCASANIDSGDDFSHQQSTVNPTQRQQDNALSISISTTSISINYQLQLWLWQLWSNDNGVRSFSNWRPLKSSSPAWNALRSVHGGDLHSMLYSLNL